MQRCSFMQAIFTGVQSLPFHRQDDIIILKISGRGDRTGEEKHA